MPQFFSKIKKESEDMSKEKRLTLNAEKRNAIANVFQSYWEREDSPVCRAIKKQKKITIK